MKKLIFVFILFAFVFGYSYASSIGVSPGSITINNVLRGGYAEAHFKVFNPNDYPINARIGIESNYTWVNWTGNSTIPPNSYGIFTVIFTPPYETPVGSYDFLISVSYVPIVSFGGTGSAVGVGSLIPVKVVINDREIRDLELKSWRIKENEVCKPIYVYVTIENKGNVLTEPNYKIELLSGAEVVTSQTYPAETLKPTKEREDTLSLSTRLSQIRCVPEGNYQLKLYVYDGDKKIAEKKKTVIIYPAGTFTVQGEVLNITATKKSSVGSLVKVTAIFKNIGEAVINAKLKGEVYKGEELIDVIESDVKTLNPGEQTKLNAYFKPKEIGNYTIKAWVSFEGKESDVYTFEVEVVKANNMWIVILVVLIAITAAVYYYWKKRQYYY